MQCLRGRLSLLPLICLVQWVSCELVRFEINLTWEDIAVAGAPRKTILTNGQFPGPELRLKQGDDVEFLVNNSLPFATSVHFHGIEQRGTPWSDGVPGLSQKPIEPGHQFLYKWKAVEYGSYIYHSHSRGQIDDGLYGAIHIQPHHSIERPFGLIATEPGELEAMHEAELNTRPVMLSDWRPLTSEQIWLTQLDSGVEGYCASAILINGKGSVYCLPQERLNTLTTSMQRTVLGNDILTDMGCMPPTDEWLGPFPKNPNILPDGFVSGCKPSEGPKESFKVEAASRYKSLDLISMAGSSTIRFSIDEHSLYVYAVDGRYIEPLLVDAVTVPIGSRYSVLVKLNQPERDYTIRAVNSVTTQILNGTATMSYKSIQPQRQNLPSTPSINEVGVAVTAATKILNETDIIPFPAEAPSTDVDRTFILNLDQYNTSYSWILGNASFPLSNEDATPLLFNRSSIPSKYIITTLNNTWVDLIINITATAPSFHPIHKHSNKYYVIGSGTSAFTWPSIAEAIQEIPESFNLVNPQMRDTFTTPGRPGNPSWLALRYHVTNPGPFFLHCHIQMHLSGGMALAILDGVDAWPEVPEGYQLPALEDR